MAKKPKPKNKKPSKRWEKYETKQDNLSRKNRFCPKCGQGCFLAVHKDRLTCGTCRYTEFLSK